MYKSTMTTEKPILNFVVDPDLLSRIDDFRFENRIASRSEAIRRLVEKGLKTLEAETAKNTKK